MEPATEPPNADAGASEQAPASAGTTLDPPDGVRATSSFAVLVHLIRRMAPILGLPSVSCEQLEAALLNAAEHSSFVGSLAGMLAGPGPAAEDGSSADWETAVRSKLSSATSATAAAGLQGNPLEVTKFEALPASTRVRPLGPC
jgi:hypothetical protein